MPIPKKIFPGEFSDDSARSADDLIDTVDELRQEQETLREGIASMSHPGVPLGTSTRAMNNTGGGIPAYGIVKIDDPKALKTEGLDEDQFKRRLYFTANLSEGDLSETIGIAQHQLRSAGGEHNIVGRFLVDGITQCRIKYTSEEEGDIRFATGKSLEEEYLVPDEGGQVEIIWREDIDWEGASEDDLTVWAIVRLGGVSNKPVYFKLKNDLVEKSEAGALAYKIYWDAEEQRFEEPDDVEITVEDFRRYDDTGLKFFNGLAGIAGTRGIAIPTKTDDGMVYLIDRLFHKARFIEFTLTSPLTTSNTSVPVDVDNHWDGMDPGATETVYNKSASSAYIFEGASGNKGLAVLDEHNGHYIIFNMECP